MLCDSKTHGTTSALRETNSEWIRLLMFGKTKNMYLRLLFIYMHIYRFNNQYFDTLKFEILQTD